MGPTLKAAGIECEVLFPVTGLQDDPTVYLWKDLLQSNFPFVKVKTIAGAFAGIDISGWCEALAQRGYDISLAERTLGASRIVAIPPAPNTKRGGANPLGASCNDRAPQEADGGLAGKQREDQHVSVNETLALMRHESTFLTLDRTAADLRFEMPYFKT